jgi:hypothetical protein
VSTDTPETAASVEYRCNQLSRAMHGSRCKNLGRMLMIYADAGGRPISHPVPECAHPREIGAARLKSITIARSSSLQMLLETSGREGAKFLLI